MQALSHFSFQITGGQHLLCDLQGGVSDCDGAVLTDPVILSMDRCYGVTDLGPEGISKHKRYYPQLTALLLNIDVKRHFGPFRSHRQRLGSACIAATSFANQVG